MTMFQRIGIVGAGPGGLMLARLLQRQGLNVTVFERDAHADDRPQGGSLDLHDTTGQRAMRLAGLEDAFAAVARPEDQGDRLYDQAGTLLFDHDGAGHNRPEIDRGDLRRILLGSLGPGTVRWGERIVAIDVDGPGAWIVSNGTAHTFDIVVGADGTSSRVRPLVSDAMPAYQGATFIELGFDVVRHPHVDALVGSGKMFAVGDHRLLIAQRNGHAHIRGYAGVPLHEQEARSWMTSAPEQVRADTLRAFAGWAPNLVHLITEGNLLGVRPLYALPTGLRWPTRAGVTLLGDAAHVMSPFSGEGVNLALCDAADLADALITGDNWDAVAVYEESMAVRATEAGSRAAAGFASVFSAYGAAPVLAHYQDRLAA